jgi:hypothetical protein
MSEAYFNAQTLARAGHRVFPAGPIWSGNADRVASSDLDFLAKIHAVDPGAMWMVACGAGLICLDTPRRRDADYLASDFCPLPATLTVHRDSSGLVRWYTVPPDAHIKFGARINSTHGFFRKAGVIAGSRHPHSGELYRILDGGEFDLSHIAPLPQTWIDGAPKNREGLAVSPRHEWQPTRSLDW